MEQPAVSDPLFTSEYNSNDFCSIRCYGHITDYFRLALTLLPIFVIQHDTKHMYLAFSPAPQMHSDVADVTLLGHVINRIGSDEDSMYMLLRRGIHVQMLVPVLAKLLITKLYTI